MPLCPCRMGRRLFLWGGNVRLRPPASGQSIGSRHRGIPEKQKPEEIERRTYHETDHRHPARSAPAPYLPGLRQKTGPGGCRRPSGRRPEGAHQHGAGEPAEGRGKRGTDGYLYLHHGHGRLGAGRLPGGGGCGYRPDPGQPGCRAVQQEDRKGHRGHRRQHPGGAVLRHRGGGDLLCAGPGGEDRLPHRPGHHAGIQPPVPAGSGGGDGLRPGVQV